MGGWVSRRRGEGGGGERILKAFQNGDQKSQDGENAASSPSDFLFFLFSIEIIIQEMAENPEKESHAGEEQKKKEMLKTN